MKGNILVYNRLLVRVKEELKDTKGVIRIRKSKNRQHNAVIKFPTIVYCKKKRIDNTMAKRKSTKGTNNDLQIRLKIGQYEMNPL